ncbi:TetR/AcrR family transcriptional regulator [Actinokineospora soli]
MGAKVRWEPRRVQAVDVVLPGETPGTRGRILLAGLKLFAERGFHGTSIRDLGREAGINSATLYAHFESKEQVLAELVLVGHRELLQRLQKALIQTGDRPVDQLKALVRTQVLCHAEFPLLAMVANAELHALSAELAGPALALREQAGELLLEVLKAGVESGGFAVRDVVLAGTAIASMGVRVANWFGPDQPYGADQVADEFALFAARVVGCEE